MELNLPQASRGTFLILAGPGLLSVARYDRSVVQYSDAYMLLSAGLSLMAFGPLGLRNHAQRNTPIQ